MNAGAQKKALSGRRGQAKGFKAWIRGSLPLGCHIQWLANDLISPEFPHQSPLLMSTSGTGQQVGMTIWRIWLVIELSDMAKLARNRSLLWSLLEEKSRSKAVSRAKLKIRLISARHMTCGSSAGMVETFCPDLQLSPTFCYSCITIFSIKRAAHHLYKYTELLFISGVLECLHVGSISERLEWFTGTCGWEVRKQELYCLIKLIT